VYACSPLRKGWAVRLWWAGCYRGEAALREEGGEAAVLALPAMRPLDLFLCVETGSIRFGVGPTVFGVEERSLV
jgi:hypothetical protein